MKITASEKGKGRIGIVGHVGVGHVHSHAGFIQDDSAGFAVAACLLRHAFPVCTTIVSVECDIDTGTIVVITEGGGTGVAGARRGITPHEATLARAAVGMDAIYSQEVAFRAFGRIYGQGVLEAPVALQTAVCLAVVDTFMRAYPETLKVCAEGMTNKVGRCLGAVLEINSVPVSVLAVINASEGGLGPDEDLEGNIMLGHKGQLMKQLGLDLLPTIIIESKAYVPDICAGEREGRFLVRANKQVDNMAVYDALARATDLLNLPASCYDDAYLRGSQSLKEATAELGKKIAELGQKLAVAETSCEKVAIVGELAILVSQDAGGVTFMSSHLHDVVGGGGMMPGSSAVLSLAVSESYIKKWKIPSCTAHDVERYIEIIEKAVHLLSLDLSRAGTQVTERRNFCEHDFRSLLD
ncbi:hypothetical protein [Desulfotalea psychrophila]|uniref:Uncharacterized protein n=1 Tax=Desulfotalea psychrophila (strain LSv54 / DSM 12343) TaxID=177439 RepID=Q6AN32_DESPS|nr:hypothetical protein [Desulfotalea psychrophila]CAG36242.1 unknown protein [Desulfotalea psychrophila LSv54]